MIHRPAIVVIAYNRPKSLALLLKSVVGAHYGDAKVHLVISIDGNGPIEVIKMADQFHWPWGGKEVIIQENRIGLRNHILLCGDLSSQFGSIIILEDDLYVSPEFYHQSLRLLQCYNDSALIGQISLYSPDLNEFAENAPFTPIDDGRNEYLMQTGASWGHILTSGMWSQFREWIDNNSDYDFDKIVLPQKVKKWPESSWKKYFNAYLVAQEKYVLYPKNSYCTNLGNIGTHHHHFGDIYNTPLSESLSQTSEIDHSNSSIIGDRLLVKYDQFMEPKLDKTELSQLGLVGFDTIESDFYGIKPTEPFSTSLFLTFRGSIKPLKSYASYLKPYHLNYKYDLPGSQIFLTRPQDIAKGRRRNIKALTAIYPARIINIVQVLMKKLAFRLTNWLRAMV